MHMNLFDNPPAITASAPGRANLIGEHIDYAGGVVLPFAISARTTVGITPRSDKTIRIRSQQRKDEIQIQWDEIEDWPARNWARYPLGVLNFIRAELPGLDIELDGRVPQGAGLSSSASLECSLAFALNEYFDLGLSPLELAKIAQRAENEYVGMPCGLMDQAASILSKANMILKFDCLTLESTYLPFNLEAHDLSILIIDSHVKHKLVDGGYASRFRAVESARIELGLDSLRHLTPSVLGMANLAPLIHKRVSHVVGEMQRVEDTEAALVREDFDAVGALMNASHASLRDLYEVSCEELDLATDIAREVGALGARMMGGGFGGSAIVLTPTHLEPIITEEVEKAFAKKKYQPPRHYSEKPSAGARLEESEAFSAK